MKSRLMHIFLAAVVFAVFLPTLGFAADTLYVAPWGNDTTGVGSYDNPYRSIGYSIWRFSVGGVLVARPGVYNEQFSFPSAYPVELRSEKGPDETIIDGAGLGTPILMSIPLGAEAMEPGQVTTHTVDGFTITCTNCTFDNGPAIEINGLSPIIRNNKIVGNVFDTSSSGSQGGGIRIDYSGASPVIYNNIIADNLARRGGGIYVSGFCSPYIYNNTIVNNTAADNYAGAGIEIAYDGSAEIRNNIIAFNSIGLGVYNESINFLSILTHSLFYANDAGAYTGGSVWSDTSGLVHANPMFVNYPADDFRLACNSPAYNQGTRPAIDTLTTTDLAGNPRVVYNSVDIGALEFVDDAKHADFYATITEGCYPFTVNFTNTSTCIDENWLWYFGDGLTSGDKNPVHQYVNPGPYTVRLIAIGDFDRDTMTKTDYIMVYEPLTADFIADVEFGCVPFSVTFTPTASDSVFTYFWDFGDGGTSELEAPTHEYTQAGKHTVRLFATNPCGSEIVTKEQFIYAEKKPAAQIISSHDSLGAELACNPYEVRFYAVAAESLTAFSWDFGDNDTSNVRNPVHTYIGGNTYSVQLIVTGLCDTNRVVRQQYIDVFPRPTAVASADQVSGCVPLPVNFDVDTTGLIDDFKWYFGDGDSAMTATTTHTYAAPGKYPVSLVISHDCGIDTVFMADSIIGRDRPTVDFTCPDAIAHAPYTAQFYDNSTNQPSEWAWIFGDGGVSAETDPQHTYEQPGIYTVALTTANECGAGDELARPVCLVVGGYELTIGEPTQSGDTTRYPVDVDTVIYDYPNLVHLEAVISPTPYRGSLTAAFDGVPGIVPPFSQVLNVVPSGDLPSGTYTVRVSATDSTLEYTDTSSSSFEYEGATMLALAPPQVDYDSVVTGTMAQRVIHVVNVAPVVSEFTLIIESAQTEGTGFSVASFAPATLDPDSAHPIIVRFQPEDRIVYNGVLRLSTNDPVVRDTVITLVGRGIPEQNAPTVTLTAPEDEEDNILINREITLEFSEPVLVDDTDTTVTVYSRSLGQRLTGQLTATARAVFFAPDQFWPPFDTLDVYLVAARVTDTVFNQLDGDADGLEEGSPADDYAFSFITGPGVYPGDTDDNRSVDERDVLPLGRFWERTGPARPLTHESFSIQPAYLWPDSAATYADADGNGVIDSTDVCPILEFWEIGGFAKVEREQAFWKELAALESDILRSIYSAIDYCPAQESAPALKGVLSEWIGESSGSVPYDFELLQNYPNPFNARTVITFTLPAPADVELVVFNTKGERIAVLEVGHKDKGRHVVVWDGRTLSGHQSASGMYFYRLKAGDYRQTRKMTLLK